MIIFTASVFSEESGPGSSASVDTYLFSSKEKRLAFIQDWVLVQEKCGHNRTEDLKYYGPGGWVYWVEQSDLEIDCVYVSGQIVKRY